MINKKTKKNILDSFKKNVISQANKHLINLNQNQPDANNSDIQNIDMDIEMKKECDNLNISSLKDSINTEKMIISNEKEFKKSKDCNDSYINGDNSYGDNYSTANSNVENDKNKLKQSLSKENIDNSIKNENQPDNETQISKEVEIPTNDEIQNANEYIDDILENLIDEEKKMNSEINPNYFDYQTEINQKMRSILIDWLIDVHNKFNYKEETLYITIYIIDSYLSKRFVQRSRFQLLGITSLFIASKLNEIYYRRITDYVFITDNTYSIEEIKYMEEDISKTLSFNFLVPSALSFYQIISKKFGIDTDPNLYEFGQFLIQTFLLDNRCLNFSYSSIACSSCYIVMKFYKIKNYHNCYNNKYYSIKNGYNSDKNGYVITKCAKNIVSVISDIFVSNLQSTIKKYNNNTFYEDIKKILGNPKCKA